MEIASVFDFKVLMKLCKALSFAEPVAHSRSKLAWTLGCGGLETNRSVHCNDPLTSVPLSNMHCFVGCTIYFTSYRMGFKLIEPKLTPESRSGSNKHIQSQ